MPSTKALPTPLLIPALGWGLGIVLMKMLTAFLQTGTFDVPIVLALLSLAACTLILLAVLLKWLRAWLLIFIFITLGALRMGIATPQGNQLSILLKGKQAIRQPITFAVKQVFSPSAKRYGIVMESLAGSKLKAELIYNSEYELLPAERYTGLAELRALNSDPILDIYPSKYEAVAYQLGKLERLPSQRKSLLPARIRHVLLRNLEAKLGDEAGWAKALLFSDSSIKYAYMDELSQSGIMHLIVVSGLHVWFIYLLVVILLRTVIPLRWAEVIFIPLIIGFAALNNWAPPITRAIIMIGTFTIAKWLQRPLSGMQSLSLSLFIITVISPTQLFSIGLQMSFLCVAVILVGLPRFAIFKGDSLFKHPWQRATENLVHALVLTTVVSIAIAPLTLYHFGKASLNGIVGNLGGIPLAMIILPLSALVLISPQGSFLFRTLHLSYSFLISLWQQWITLCSRLPLRLNGHYYSAYRAVALAVIILWGFLLLRGKYKYALRFALPTAALAGLLFWLPQHSQPGTDIHIFSCGVADCSLIRLPDDTVIMIDTGGIKDFTFTEKTPTADKLLQDSWAEAKLLPWLNRNGIEQIDYLVLTHLHSDHAGGILAVISNIRVRNLIVPEASTRQPFWTLLQDNRQFTPQTIHAVSDTCSFATSTMRLKVLSPDADYDTMDENEGSLVCRIDTREKRLLFTADIGAETEAYLLSRYPEELACNYLKVPHHGSGNSSSTAFLAQTGASEAWLTCSARNRFGFPHPQTVQRFQKAQIPLRSTADGTIRVVLD